MKKLLVFGAFTLPVVAANAQNVPENVAPTPENAPQVENPAPDANEEIETVISIVEERSDSQIGRAGAASEGIVGPKQLERRPILRPGELIETVPGVIITQHSGSGKANQYFLRGFNLDHGTDLAISLDGMPLNMPTHGHGQGYIDLNLLIPELVSGLRYRKGAYEADQGDFSSAGSVDISYARRLGLETGVAATQSLDIGNFGRRRALITGQAGEKLIYGFEALNYDGPWDLPEDFKKLNGLLRYSSGTTERGFTLTGMAYDGEWNSTDQVPRRAVDAGLIGRFGNIDPTNGGKSSRYSLSGQLRRDDFSLGAYAIDYRLNLWSNFTYFLDDPIRGDQFEQADRRRIYGIQTRRDFKSELGTRPMINSLGFQARRDDISGVGLYRNQNRTRLATVRADSVEQTSLSPYFENRISWSDRFRTVAGLRYDRYRFDVASSIAANSGRVSDSILSPKFEAAYRARPELELYAAAGRGFHSNDARGTTITVDPNDPNVQAQRVTPLVRSNFAEVGARRVKGNLQSTLALWGLNFQSELLFIGDAGTTEASRPSKRAGIEFTNYWTIRPGLILDADFAFARARFRDNAPEGNRIPGAVEGVIAIGASYEPPQGWGGALRLRYFGPRPLVEDNSVRSKSSTLLNGRIGYKLKNGLKVSVESFNLLNSKVSDIDYFYASRLPGESADGVEDIHTHPAEKRSFRVAISRSF
ncbi:MAG TPA: TonB-dependent receptor [Abditibacterium sp.]|jgi:hypothetical protein